jgi:hypothetical protein
VDEAVVRRALRSELESRGYEAKGDTVSLRGDLQVLGEGDLAAALFEFNETADEACVTMYQGRWLAHLPPRFAVLPVSEKGQAGLDMLTQSGLSVLFYEHDGEVVRFLELPGALALFKNLSR